MTRLGGRATAVPSTVLMWARGRAQWAPDDRQLASGGNDNAVAVWVAGGGAEAGPIFRDTSHSAAVKALAWSPHQHGLLATGGGTTDRHIRRAMPLALRIPSIPAGPLFVSKLCREGSSGIHLSWVLAAMTPGMNAKMGPTSVNAKPVQMPGSSNNV